MTATEKHNHRPTRIITRPPRVSWRSLPGSPRTLALPSRSRHKSPATQPLLHGLGAIAAVNHALQRVLLLDLLLLLLGSLHLLAQSLGLFAVHEAGLPALGLQLATLLLRQVVDGSLWDGAGACVVDCDLASEDPLDGLLDGLAHLGHVSVAREDGVEEDKLILGHAADAVKRFLHSGHVCVAPVVVVDVAGQRAGFLQVGVRHVDGPVEENRERKKR